MNKYFFKVTMTYTTKNKAHKAMQDFARLNDCMLLLSKESLDKFIAHFKQKLEWANATFKRCQDLEFSGSNRYDGTRLYNLSIEGNYVAVIYRVKNEG